LKLRQVEILIIFGLTALWSFTTGYSQTVPTGLQISPDAIDFGEAHVNSDTPPRTITLSNPTKSNITMAQIIISGIDFSEKHDCGPALAPSAQCTIQVSFKPAIPGPRIGNLDVMGSDATSPHFIALNGIGD
jgi:hypothetical protein